MSSAEESFHWQAAKQLSRQPKGAVVYQAMQIAAERRVRLSDGVRNIAVGMAPSSLGLAQKDGETNAQTQSNRSNATWWSKRLEGVSPDCRTAESFQFVPSEEQPVLPSSCYLNLFFVFFVCVLSGSVGEIKLFSLQKNVTNMFVNKDFRDEGRKKEKTTRHPFRFSFFFW